MKKLLMWALMAGALLTGAVSCSQNNDVQVLKNCDMENFNTFLQHLDSLGKNNPNNNDEARKVWNRFYELCQDHKYEEALNYFYEQGTSANFFINFGNTDELAMFHSGIIFPMIQTFDSTNLENQLTKCLDEDIMLMEIVMTRPPRGSGYIPHYYPELFETQIRLMLQNNAPQEEIEGSFSRMISCITNSTNDTLFATYNATSLKAKLTFQSGNKEEALRIITDFKKGFLAQFAHKPEFKDTYEACHKEVDEIINSLEAQIKADAQTQEQE